MENGGKAAAKSAVRVLIMSMVEADRNNLRDCFLSRNFTPILASDGPEGIRLAIEHKPSLIVMDMRMGSMKGTEILKTLKRRVALRNTPVIAVTGLRRETTILMAAKLGIDEYLTRPLSNELLFERVKKIFERYKLEMPQ